MCHTFNHDTSQLPSCRRSRACTADSSTAAHHVHQIPTLHVSNMAIYGQSKKVFLLAVSTLIHVQTALAPTPAPPPSLLPPITHTHVCAHTQAHTQAQARACACVWAVACVCLCVDSAATASIVATAAACQQYASQKRVFAAVCKVAHDVFSKLTARYLSEQQQYTRDIDAYRDRAPLKH